MAENQDWAKRRQRIVKCKIHGLSYDPEMTSGCVRCRKEGLNAEPRQKPQLVVLLLALLGITAIAYRIIEAERATPFLVEDNSEAETIERAKSSASQLDPETYKQALQGVDRALFETPAQNLGAINDQITGAFRRLSRELEGNASARTNGTLSAIGKLMASTSGSFSLDSLQDLRNGWSELRQQHFGNASWYTIAKRVDPRTDRAALTLYRSVANDLAALLNEGAGRAESLVTPTAPNRVNQEEKQRNEEEWRLFQSDWRQQIARLKSQLPGRPAASSTPEILVAAQRLEQAFSKISSLTNGSLPSETHLDEAHNAIERARRSFDELLR